MLAEMESLSNGTKEQKTQKQNGRISIVGIEVENKERKPKYIYVCKQSVFNNGRQRLIEQNQSTTYGIKCCNHNKMIK